MKILLNNSQEILAYASFGDLAGSIEFDGSVPDDFKSNFKPSYYLYQDDQIVVNPDYQEPTISIPEPSEPSKTDKQVAQLTYQQMMTTQDVTTLQTQNAQMAYQLMMLGGTK